MHNTWTTALVFSLILLLPTTLAIAYDQPFYDEADEGIFVEKGHHLVLCEEPKMSFERQAYDACMRKHGLSSSTDELLWRLGGGWKPVPTRF